MILFYPSVFGWDTSIHFSIQLFIRYSIWNFEKHLQKFSSRHAVHRTLILLEQQRYRLPLLFIFVFLLRYFFFVLFHIHCVICNERCDHFFRRISIRPVFFLLLFNRLISFSISRALFRKKKTKKKRYQSKNTTETCSNHTGDQSHILCDAT